MPRVKLGHDEPVARMSEEKSGAFLEGTDPGCTHHPRFGEQYRFDFDYERDEDDGKGL
jgi:hypothetical protein